MKRKLFILLSMFTLCCYAQLTPEGFEGTWTPLTGTASAGGPAGWAIVNVAGPNEYWEQFTGSTTAYEGSHAAYIGGEDAATGTTTEDWLITPSFTLPANGQLHFFSKLSADGDQGGNYKVMIGTTIGGIAAQTNVAAYMQVQTWTETQLNPVQTQWTEKVVAIPASFPAGTEVYLAFVAQGNNGDGWLIDNVQVTSQCPPPINFIATSITGTSATLGWTETGTATGWEIEVLPATAVPTGVGTIVTVNPYMVTGLTGGDYKFYIKSVCDATTASAWVGPLYFSTQYPNYINGVVKYDINGDGICNNQDAALPAVEIQVTINDQDTYSTYTTDQGTYTVYNLPPGTSTVTLQPIPPVGFAAVDPTIQEVTFTGTDNQVVNLCLPTPASVNDLSVSLLPVTSAVPGFNAFYQLKVVNNGSAVITNVMGGLTFNDVKLDYVSSEGGAVTGNVVNFTIGSVQPFTTAYYDVTFYLAPPPANAGGDLLAFTVALTQTEVDASPADNNYTLTQVIVNSFDPNDISVSKGPFITEGQAQDYFDYTIRFQNTGSTDATNIRLTNTLDDNLDWNTFSPVTASHNYTVTRSGNQLEFKFNNIHLPDSAANEPESHGYVTYRIKPKDTYGLGDIISNTADIYFDFNAPIVTNTVTTEVVETAGVYNNNLNKAVVYPNPVKDILNVKLQQGEVKDITVFDVNGRLCLTAQNSTAISTAALKSGIYFLRITTPNGVDTLKIIKE